MMNQLKVYAKSVAAFVAAIIANAVTDLVTGTAPWPQTGAEWLRYIATSFGVAIAAWAARNKITQSQLDKDPGVPAGTVLAAPPPSGGYRNPWRS